MKPSVSTVATGTLGLAVGIIVVWLISVMGKIEVPNEVASAIGTLAGAVIGLFFNGGKASDTE